MTKRELDWAEAVANSIFENSPLAEDWSAIPAIAQALRSAHRRGMKEAAGICEGYPLDPNDGVGYFITDGIHGDWTRDGETARVRRHCAAAILAAIKNVEQPQEPTGAGQENLTSPTSS